jgi:hypothetical protein
MRVLFAIAALALLAGCGATQPSGPRGSLHGVVLDGGNPVANQDVALSPVGAGPEGSIEIGVTNGSGQFAFSGLAAGLYVASAMLPRYVSAADTVVIPNGEAAPETLRALPGGAFYGTTAAGALVDVTGLLALSVSDTAGTWVLHGIPPGNWVVEATAGANTKTAAGTISAPLDSVEVVITFPAPAAIVRR